MRKIVGSVLMTICFFSFSTGWTAPWAVMSNIGTGGAPGDPGFEAEAVYTIDLGANPPQVYGPFLEGELVTPDPGTGEPQYGQGVLDVAHIPGTNDALVSNFGGMTIYRINFDDPENPVVVGSLVLDNGTIQIPAEDIAVSPDGKLAIVSDGGFASAIAFIDLDPFTLSSMVELYLGTPFDPATPPPVLPPLMDAQAVAIAPDNQTVIMADYLGGRVVYGRINPARNGLVSVKQLPLCPNWNATTATCATDDYVPWPVNVAISPDGKTALVMDAFWGMVSILRISAPGQVLPGTPFQLWGFPDEYSDYLLNTHANWHDSRAGSQSAVFSPDSRRAYLLQNSTYTYTGNTTDGWTADDIPDQLSWIRIDGPGQASVGGVWVAELINNTNGSFFGVDTLAINKDGNTILVGNPSSSTPGSNAARVDLTTFSVSTVPTDSNYPIGVDFLTSRFNWPMFLPAITTSH